MADGTFWPVPITLDISAAEAAAIKDGEEIALVRKGEVFATMKVNEKFEMTEADKKLESVKVFRGEGDESVGGNC
jgi:sulfate adenylyltransferase